VILPRGKAVGKIIDFFCLLIGVVLAEYFQGRLHDVWGVIASLGVAYILMILARFVRIRVSNRGKQN
jgi:hypothetical protein